MNNYYLKHVNHDELIGLFQFFFPSSERKGVDYKITFYKNEIGKKPGVLEVYFNKNYKIKKIDDSNLPKHLRLELSKRIKDSLIEIPIKKIARYICFVNRNIEGAFRYKEDFQILPMPSDAPKMSIDKTFTIQNYPCILEIEYNETKESAINTNRRGDKMLSVIRILNALTRYNFSISQKGNGLLWGFSYEEPDSHKTKIFQSGYRYDNFETITTEFTDILSYQKIDIVNENEYYQFTFQDGGNIKLPSTIELMINKINMLSEESRVKFDIASFYFQKAIEVMWQSSSLSFICFVISIEALMKSKKEKCKECGQNKYSIKNSFNDFIDSFLPLSESSSYFKNKMYDTRSLLAHGGGAFKSDINGGIFSGMKENHESDLQWGTYFIMRILFYNWLDAQIK